MANRTGVTRLKLVVLILLPITLVTLDASNFTPLEWGKDVVRDALSPVISGVRSVTRPITDAWKAVGNYDELERQNEQLREELEELRGKELDEVSASVTLQQVLEELDIPYLTDIPTAKARVIRQLGNFPSLNVDIDKGSSSGIEVGMPAVTSAGLVGRVVEVSRIQSRIRLITDADFELGVRIVGFDTVAVAKGSGAGRALVIGDGIPLSLPVEQGMLVTTSGIENSVYPPDIPVGLVQEIQVDPNLDQVLYLQPTASLDVLNFVTVLLYENAL